VLLVRSFPLALFGLVLVLPVIVVPLIVLPVLALSEPVVVDVPGAVLLMRPAALLMVEAGAERVSGCVASAVASAVAAALGLISLPGTGSVRVSRASARTLALFLCFFAFAWVRLLCLRTVRSILLSAASARVLPTVVLVTLSMLLMLPVVLMLLDAPGVVALILLVPLPVSMLLDAPGVTARILLVPDPVLMLLDVPGVVALMLVSEPLVVIPALVPGVIARMVVAPVTGSRSIVVDACAAASNAVAAQATAIKPVKSLFMGPPIEKETGQGQGHSSALASLS
jgi:hypothetical protein